MIKKYGKLINIFLVLILGFITIKFIQIKDAKEEISKLYVGETSMVLSQTGLSHEEFIDISKELNETEGVTATNTYLESNGEKQNTLFIDKIYYDKYLGNLDIEGDRFTNNDFVIEFNENTVIPIIVDKGYAEKNNLSIGEETTIENFLPNACELYSDETSVIGTSDGTTVLNSETNNKDLCASDSRYDYLENENGFDAIPAKVIGLFDGSSYNMAGFPKEAFPTVDVIAPSFIVDNSNIDFYNVEDYLNGSLTVTKSQIQLFVDYEKISDEEFNQKISSIEKKYGKSLTIDRSTDWKKFEIEDTIKIYNQSLVNYVFISIVILLLWIIQSYYRFMYLKYDCAVLITLGTSKRQIVNREFKLGLPIAVINLVVILILGQLLSNTLLFLLYFLLICLIEYLASLLYCNCIKQSVISKILSGGSL